MNPKVIYLGYYDKKGISKGKRRTITSSENKIDSILECLSHVGINPIIVSPASSLSVLPSKGYNKFDKNGLKNISPFSFGSTKLGKLFDYIWIKLWLYCKLFYFAFKNYTIIAYHSPYYVHLLRRLKKIVKYKLILELEEIYADVNEDKTLRFAEEKLAEVADAYIFPTELLNDKLNKSNKPYVIIHGTYKVEPQIVDKFNDGKIHIVYAGTFDPRKGGAAAAAAAEFLPKNFHLHICGFGSKEDTDEIKRIISQVSKDSKANVSFHGLLKGRDYLKFIQKCHIGLSTQDPSAAFNATSFPSKILSYMANGLSVVSIDIPAVRTSAIGNYINYYQVQNPQNIANAIINTDSNNDNRKIIEQLKIEFERNIAAIL